MEHEARVRRAIAAGVRNGPAYADIDAAAAALNVALSHYVGVQAPALQAAQAAAAAASALGDFVCHLFRNTVRLGKSGKRKVCYLFSGATYDTTSLERIEIKAKMTVYSIFSALELQLDDSSRRTGGRGALAGAFGGGLVRRKAMKQPNAPAVKSRKNKTLVH